MNSNKKVKESCQSNYSKFYHNPPESASTFSPQKSSHKNPCPVCERTKDGDCRILPNAIFCHTYEDAKKGQSINGWICSKASDGHTATFVRPLDKNLSTTQVEANKAAKADIDANRKALVDERIAAELPLTQRDAEYRKILSTLTLSAVHKEKLISRGFTEESIKRVGFVSASKKQPISIDTSDNLPGVEKGQLVNFEGSRILIPVTTTTGEIAFLSSHPDAANGFSPTQPKYKPLSSRENPCHIGGEVPIAYYPSQTNSVTESNRVFLIEGHGFKDKLACQRHDINVLAANGGQFFTSPNKVKNSLAHVCTESAEIILCPDAGDVGKEQQISKWEKTASLIKSLGYKVTLAWWNQKVKKTDKDIDELESLTTVKFITIEQFKEISKVELKNQGIEKSKIIVKEWFNENFAKWKNSKRYVGQHKMKKSLFDTKEIEIPESNAILSVKSGLGTGKTIWLIDQIKKSPSGALIIGYRNNLLAQTGSRAEQQKLAIYPINEEDGDLIMLDENGCVMGCLDSIAKMDGHFLGKDIYLDETCSVILHALSGGTLKTKQALAISILSKALRECNRVFLLDGNLSDLVCNFIQKLAPEKKLFTIENTQQIPPQEIIFVEGIDPENEVKKTDKSPLIKRLLESDCIPFITLDSRTLSKVLEVLLNQNGKYGLVLNQETVSEDWAKEFLKDPNEYIKIHKPQFIIFTPTAESGVSVEINEYFTDKFSFFCGVIGTDSQHQMMFRLRDNQIPHWIFCPEVSQIRDRNTPYTYSKNEYAKKKTDRFWQSSQRAGDTVNDYYKKALDREQKEWEDLSNELGALDCFEQNNLRACLIYSLEKAGHSVSIQQELKDEEISEATKQARRFVHETEAKEIFAAVEFETRQEAEEASKKNPRMPVQRKIQKTFLLDKIPGIKESGVFDEQFVLNCHVLNSRYIGQQYNYWLLNNMEIAKARNEADWYHAVTSEHFLRGRLAKNKFDTIWALNELKILDFEGKEYNKKSPLVLAFWETLKTRTDIQLALNMRCPKETTEGKERLEILGKLLQKIGLTTKYIRKENVDGERLRKYKTILEKTDKEDGFNFSKAREEILKCIETKLTAWFENPDNKPDWSEPRVLELHKEWDSILKGNEESLGWFENQDQIEAVTFLMEESQNAEMLQDLQIFYPKFVIQAASSLIPSDKKALLVELFPGLAISPFGTLRRYNYTLTQL